MELIGISDIYGDIRIVKEILSKLAGSKNNRIIVIAGDIDAKIYSEYYLENVTKIIELLSENCRYLIYVPGDSDEKTINIQKQNVVNIDHNYFIVEVDGIKLGFLGLGGAPQHSVREKTSFPYLWDENIQVVSEDIMMSLKIYLEKVWINEPDYIILVTHSPPYGIADYSKPITLKEEVILEEILEEDVVSKTEKIGKGPRHLGSRTLRNFIKYYKPDIHIFGHVHKQGGKVLTINETTFINVSHLSPLPYRLTGRKYLSLKLTKENKDIRFYHVVYEWLSFPDFLEKYL